MSELPEELRKIDEGFLVKLLRAQEHFTSLETEIKAFLQRNPYRVVRDAQPERTEYRVKVVEDFPPHLSAVAGDVLQNARSALDHVAWRLGGEKANRETSFPIYAKRDDYFAKDRRGTPAPTSGVFKIESFPEKAQTVIESVQPYHGHELGLSLLRLHDLARLDRHRLLHLVGGASDNFNLRAGRGRNERGDLIVLPGDLGAKMILDVRLGAFEHDTPIGIFTHPPDVEVECDFAFYVAMREGETGEFQFPVLGGLAGLILAAKDVIVKLGPFVPAQVKRPWAGGPTMNVDLGEELIHPVAPGQPYQVRVTQEDVLRRRAKG